MATQAASRFRDGGLAAPARTVRRLARGPAAYIRSRASRVLAGYAQVFFSGNLASGALFAAATFVVPRHGFAGLCALLLSDAWARFLQLDERFIKEGFFAVNGLLLGLALGMSYRFDLAFLLLLVLATFLGVVVGSGLKGLFEAYLQVPVLSLPFVLCAWLVLAAGRGLGGLSYTLGPFEATALAHAFPEPVGLFLSSLGAAFFQVNVLSGLLVAAALLLSSRHAFVLALTGYLAGSGVSSLLGFSGGGLAGFNFALAAIVLGGVYVLPGPGSLFLAALSGGLAALVTAASAVLLAPLGLPPLAFPFVAVSTVLLYALKSRTRAGRFLFLPFPESSPERNFKKHKNAAARFVTGEIPSFELPLRGEWTVSQGFFGAHTHQGPWAHAWDFEIRDEEGLPFAGSGENAEDFYCYGKSVYAPGDGRVACVVDHVEDNPVGHVDTRMNWGNMVILWHYGSVYTALCHLRPGSVRVGEGQFVRQGQELGRVGNSGRSPRPHLHFQVQLGPSPGAPTLASELLHIMEKTDSGARYRTRAVPKTGARLSPLAPDASAFDCAAFPVGRKAAYRFVQNGRKSTETWFSEIDPLGNRSLVCREKGAALDFFLNKNLLLFKNYRGPRDTVLFWLFAAAPRIPLARRKAWWSDCLPAELFLSGPGRFLFDLLEPLASLARLRSRSRMEASGETVQVRTGLRFSGPLARGPEKYAEARAVFEKGLGLTRLEVKRANGTEVEAELESIEDSL